MDVENSAPNASASAPASRFKVIGVVAMAMRRFQASLNPTYSYGKRSSSDGESEHVTEGHRVIVQPKQVGPQSARTASGRTTSGRTISGRPNSAGQHHGYKGNLLFRPLASPEPVQSS